MALCDIEKLLQSNGSTLKNYDNMPYPIMDHQLVNRLIEDELSFFISSLHNEHDTLLSSLTDEQRRVYTKVITAVEENVGGVFFLYGYGGTGKTYVWKTLSAAIRCKGDIVLNVASSGIATLLLEGGRIAHSRFTIPINATEDSVCSISPDSDLAGLLR